MKLPSVWAVVFLIGCGADEPETTSIETAIVNPGAPYLGSAVANPAAYPALAVRGRLPESPFDDASEPAAHQARYSDGTNLGSAAVTDRSTFQHSFGLADAANLQSPAFRVRLNEALFASDMHMGDLAPGALKLAADVFSDIPGFHSNSFGPSQSFAGWTPARARWLDSQWQRAPGARLIDPETHYQYPTPMGLATMPERGARLYCAAREVARHQATASLGQEVLIPLNVLGTSLDIGVFEPTAYVDQPQKFIGSSSDGAQAFTVPMQFGLVIWPIRNILPPLPEIRYPVVMSTADGEMATDVGRTPIYEDKVCLFGGALCIPVVRVDYRTRYKTIVHADAIQSASQAMVAGGSVPLFWAGPMLVTMELGFGASVGAPIGSLAIPAPPPFDTVPLPVRNMLFDDRILRLAIPPVGWPAEYRKTSRSDSNYDGYWSLGQAYPPDSPGTEDFDVHSIDGDPPVDTNVAVEALAASAPFRAAVHADDDHHVGPASELALSGGIELHLGYDASIASIMLTAGGSLTGVIGIAHDIRDAVTAVFQVFSVQPIAGVTITPTTYGEADLNFNVHFHLEINVVFDTIKVDYDLVNKTIPIKKFEKPWTEEHRLRIGTESTVSTDDTPPLNDITRRPKVFSHIGSGPAFESLPAPGSVNSCLAETKNVDGPPPKLTCPPPTHEIAHVEACLFTDISVQIDPCLNPPPMSSPDPHDQCEAAKLAYMCGSVSKEQWFGPRFVLAHRLALGAPPPGKTDHIFSDDLDKMSKAIKVCADADKATIGPPPDGATKWFYSKFDVGPCDTYANLSAVADVITSTGEPGEVGSGACH